MSLREKFQNRTLFYGGSSAVAVLLVAGILVFLVLLGNRYSLRWDLTRGKSHSLSAVSRSLLKEVNKPLTLTVFYPDGFMERQQAREVLELYTRQNPNVSYRFLDPDKDPVRADQAGYRRYGNVLLEYDGRRQLAEGPEEEPVSEALRRVLQKQQKKLYFLTGHGERTGPKKRRGFQVAKKTLKNEGYDLADLNLLTEGQVPPEAAVVIIAAPQKDLLPQEVAALQAYLKGGGRLFLLLEPFQNAGLKDFLAGYGVNLDNGTILELNQLTQDRAILSPIVTKYGASRITRDFYLTTIFPKPRPLFLNKELKTVTLLPLVTTSKASWEKFGQDWQKDKKNLFDPKQDKKGPFTLAVLVEPKSKPKPPASEKSPAVQHSYLAVFGDADFAANEFFNQLGNGDLFLNTVHFLAAEEKQIIIRKTGRKVEPLLLSGWQTLIIFTVSVILLPLVMLSAGVAAYLRRRGRR